MMLTCIAAAPLMDAYRPDVDPRQFRCVGRLVSHVLSRVMSRALPSSGERQQPRMDTPDRSDGDAQILARDRPEH